MPPRRLRVKGVSPRIFLDKADNSVYGTENNYREEYS
jgi:hypothetical protein